MKDTQNQRKKTVLQAQSPVEYFTKVVINERMLPLRPTQYKED
jgi:hypothetical protein